MNITGVRFFRFVAVLFFIYYLVPRKLQWVVLLAGSAFFYWHCGWKAALLLLLACLLSWGFGLLIEKRKHKLLLLAAVSTVFLLWLLLMRLPFKSVIIPTGLSFFGLQCIAYCVELYRGNAVAERNPLKLLLYISFFPHVLQGPFADYNGLNKQFFEPHSLNYDETVKAVYRIAFGLMKKLVVANRLHVVLDQPLFTGEGSYGATVVLLAILYAFELYADFSGYMDIALGVAQLFGIKLIENFDAPYLSKSMAEFWRRWHRSLGLYFKNYVFYPLLRSKPLMALQKHFRSRKQRYLMKVVPVCIALAVNWTLIGIWHGFGINYLVYDWICGGIIILSELLAPLYAKVNNSAPKLFKSRFMDVLRTLRTFLLICASLLFFRNEDMQATFRLFRNLFEKPALYETAQFIYWNIYDVFLLAIPLCLIVIADVLRFHGRDVRSLIRRLPLLLRWGIYVCAALLIWIAKSVDGGVGFAYAVF